MSKEQTAEEMYNEHFKEEDTTEGYFIKSVFSTTLQEGIVLFAKEYATLKLQEKDKYISKLEETIKTYESGSATIEKQLQEQAKEIERLKGGNDNNEEHF